MLAAIPHQLVQGVGTHCVAYLIDFKMINRPELCDPFTQHLAQICSSTKFCPLLWLSSGVQ